MAVTGIRKYLTDNGINNADVGYDNGRVTIKGKNFMNAAIQQNDNPSLGITKGSTFADPNELSNALKQYKASEIPPADTNTAVATDQKVTPDTPVKPSEPLFKVPEKFSYDANTDPSYQAALRQAKEGAQTATNDAMVSLGSRGIGNSSVAIDRGNQIQQKAIGNVNDTILPQLMSQAYGRYQDQNNNDYRNALANYNVGQDQLKNGQWDKNFAAGRQDAATAATGIFNPSGVSTDQANQEMLKNSAAYATASPEVQKQLHDRNVVLAQLLGKTYDPNTGTYTEGQGFAGTKTIQAKQLDSNLNEVAYGHARDSLLDKRYETKFNQDIKQQGFENAIKIAVQEHQISNDNAQLAISKQNADTSRTNSSWAKDPNNPDNLYKQSQINKNNASAEKLKTTPVSSKVSTDNYGLISQDIGDAKDLAEAYALIEQNVNVLTDADYKKLKSEARLNFK